MIRLNEYDLAESTEKLGEPYIILHRDRVCREQGCRWLAANGRLCRRHRTRLEHRHGTLTQRLRWACEVALDLIYDAKYAYHDRRRT